jgi:phosphate-selective porin
MTSVVKREVEEAELRSIWERMNQPGDVLHGGSFDQ